MLHTAETTIAAIATAPGQGAVGIVRLSGPDSLPILEKLFTSSKTTFQGCIPYCLHHGKLQTPTGIFLDDVLVTFMPGPASFTGENVVEIHGHGGPVTLTRILQTCIEQGALPAGPGEFSKRAVLHGRMDLTQAEAVMELIAATSEYGALLAGNRLQGLLGKAITDLRDQLTELRIALCVAVDFPEEELECLPPQELDQRLAHCQRAMQRLLAAYKRNHCWNSGATVALAGQVNAGKSSLLNAILGKERALVSDIPGTTRDYLEESLLLEGLPIRLTDTAGLRETMDQVENMGITRSRDILQKADAILLLIDASTQPGEEDKALAEQYPKALIVPSKTDLLQNLPAWTQIAPWKAHVQCPVSAHTGEGLERLLETLRNQLVTGPPANDELVPNERQKNALEKAHTALQTLRDDLEQEFPYDLLAVHLDSACHHLEELTGTITPQDVLNQIFSSFCIGK